MRPLERAMQQLVAYPFVMNFAWVEFGTTIRYLAMAFVIVKLSRRYTWEN